MLNGRKWLGAGLTAAALVVSALALPYHAAAYDDRYDDRYETRPAPRDRNSYNDEYIFATTRMVNDWDAPAGVKVPLFPPAIVIDLVFLPAEVIAGMF